MFTAAQCMDFVSSGAEITIMSKTDDCEFIILIISYQNSCFVVFQNESGVRINVARFVESISPEEKSKKAKLIASEFYESIASALVCYWKNVFAKEPIVFYHKDVVFFVALDHLFQPTLNDRLMSGHDKLMSTQDENQLKSAAHIAQAEITIDCVEQFLSGRRELHRKNQLDLMFSEFL